MMKMPYQSANEPPLGRPEPVFHCFRVHARRLWKMEGEGLSTVRGGTACQREEREDSKKEDSKTQRVERWKCAPPSQGITAQNQHDGLE